MSNVKELKTKITDIVEEFLSTNEKVEEINEGALVFGESFSKILGKLGTHDDIEKKLKKEIQKKHLLITKNNIANFEVNFFKNKNTQTTVKILDSLNKKLPAKIEKRKKGREEG